MATRVLVPGAGGFNSEDTGQPLAAAPSGDGQTAAWTDRRGRSRRCDVVGALTDGGRRPKITSIICGRSSATSQQQCGGLWATPTF